MANTCALCNLSLDPESPLSCYQRNPETFREAWMHIDCATMAFEELKGQPASNAIFDDRQDEYLTRFG
jgi:hypothetical protein